MRYKELIVEYLDPKFFKLWLNVNTGEQIFVPDDMDHIGLVKNDPERFGVNPEEAKSKLRGTMYYSPYSAELAGKDGWVRIFFHDNTLELETISISTAWRALNAFIKKGVEIDECRIDIVSNGIVASFYHLRGDRLEFFIKKKRMPPKSMFEDEIDDRLLEKIRWAIGNDVNKAQQFSQKDQSDEYFSLIWVNIKKLLDNTNPDQKLDVADPTGGENTIGNRIEKAMDYFSNGEYMDPSIVSLGYRGLDFTDGRHRLVAAYRLGAKVAPILVPKEEANEIMELLK